MDLGPSSNEGCILLKANVEGGPDLLLQAHVFQVKRAQLFEHFAITFSNKMLDQLNRSLAQKNGER